MPNSLPSKINHVTTLKAYKYLLVQLFFQNYFFIFFSFANCVLPLAITLIVACSHSTVVDPINFVMATGMIAAFMIPFYQLGFTFSLSILNLLSNMKKNDSSFMGLRQKYIIAQEYIGSVLIGAVFSLIFCGVSVAYIHVAGNYPTTPKLAECGNDFIFVVSPTVLVSLLNSVAIFNIFYKLGNFRSTLIVLGELAINLVLVSVIGLFTPWLGIYGFAIGLLVGYVLNFIILNIIGGALGIRVSFRVTKDTKRHIFKVFRKMLLISLSNVYFVFVRIVMVLAMGFSYKIYKDAVPANFVLVKVVYFLILYALTFIGSGSSYTINYLKSAYQKYPNIFNASYRTNWMIPLFAFVMTAGFSAAFYFSVPAMVHHFTINSPARLFPVTNPAHVGWPGKNGVQGMMGLPYNATLLLICIAMPINATSAAMIIEPVNRKKKKNRFLVLWPEIIKPTFTLVFIVGFGFGMFGRKPFANMESFATAFLVNAVVLFFIQLTQFSIWNKKFRENYKKINFVNILSEYLLFKNKQNFGKIVEYHLVARNQFRWPSILSGNFKLQEHPYQKIRETIRNEMPKLAEEAKAVAEKQRLSQRIPKPVIQPQTPPASPAPKSQPTGIQQPTKS